MASYRECIAVAAEFLNMTEIAAALRENSESALSENDGKDLKLLIGCASLVASEIASRYFPLIATENVKVKNGFIAYESLKKKFSDIVCVKVSGVKKRFDVGVSGIKLLCAPFSGDAEVSYSYAPAAAEIGGETEWKSELLGARVFGYGIACEYCIINGMSEAVLWDKRYKDALSAAGRGKREMRVKPRRWI